MNKPVSLLIVLLLSTLSSFAVKTHPYSGSRIFWDSRTPITVFNGGGYARVMELQDGRLMACCEWSGIRISFSSNKGQTWRDPTTIVKIRMAATQSIAVTKQEIEKMVVTNAAADGVKANMENADFVKTMIASVVKAFNPDNASPVALDLILPESLKAQVEPFVKTSLLLADKYDGHSTLPKTNYGLQ